MGGLERAHIWACAFATSGAFEALLEERGDGIRAPLSAFAASQGEVFYDHDFFYFEPLAGRPVAAVLRDLGGNPDATAAVEQAWEARRPEGAEGLLFGDAPDFEAPRDHRAEGVEIRYLGEFAHWG